MATFLDLAVRHQRAGRCSEAMAICRAVLQSEPDSIAAFNLMGVLLHQEGRHTEAAEALAASVRLCPEFTQGLLNLGAVNHASGDSEKALVCFRRLALLQPDLPLAYGWLGFLQQEAGDLDQAAALFRRAMLGDTTAGNAINANTVLLANGMVDEAVVALRRGLSIAPGHGHLLALLGGARLAAGELREARRLFMRARSVEPSRREAVQGLLRCARYEPASATGLPGGLLVRGHFSGVSGYAHMTDRFSHGLLRRGLPLDRVGLLGDEAAGGAATVQARTALSFVTPVTLERVPGLQTVLFTMFEGARIPQAWMRLSGRADLIVVPTESSRAAWSSRGFSEDRLRIVPLGVDPQPPLSDAGAADGAGRLSLVTARGRDVADFRYRFLNVSDLVARKNLDGLLRVWMRATSASDDAVLILKAGKGGPQAVAAVADLVRRTEAAVGRRLSEAAPLVIVGQTLDEQGMALLFRQATHYWSLSHGEGWDLPMSMAGAMGLQLLAPRHSAYLDYLDDRVAHMIPAVPAPARQPYSDAPWPPFFGLDWWNPDEDAAADLIGRIVRGDAGTPRSARRHLLERFTWDRATDRLLATLRDCGFL